MKRFLALTLSVIISVGCGTRTRPPFSLTNTPMPQPSIPNAPTSASQDALQAIIDAHRDAEADSKGDPTGVCLGAGCGIFGIGASYVYREGIPPHRLTTLQGKSEIYILTYTEEYAKERHRLRTKDAVMGWVAIILVAFAIIVIVDVNRPVEIKYY